MSTPRVPGYWMHETSGVLRPVVLKYLNGNTLDDDELAVMRLYLRQWVAGDFAGAGVDTLRRRVDRIATMSGLRSWLADALELGIDPL